MRASGLWLDVTEMPEALARTLEGDAGLADAARILSDPGVRRVVATGNGAAYYVAFALQLASLAAPTGPELIALPAGAVADPAFAWRPGDRLLAVSSSGEFKDVVRAIEQGAPRPVVAITAHAESTLGRLADATCLQTVLHQRAITHTQALAGALAVGLRLWGRVTGDPDLAALPDLLPERLATAIVEAPGWAEARFATAESPEAAASFGGGPAWAAALEGALLLKEISRIPAEGAETREGATSVMYGLHRRCLVLALPTDGDRGYAEAVDVCRATGARVEEVPGGTGVDRRLAFATLIPGLSAAAGVLAERLGHDIDNPTWTDAYYATARAEGVAP